VALVGLEGRIVEVEADIGAGLPRTVLVGLPDSALYQARDRCKAAVSNSGQEWPISLLTINLSPATLPKAGSHYDLAIIGTVLAAQGVFRAEELRRSVLLGELGLDGRLRPVRGVLPATLAAQQAGFTRVIVPLRQAGEAQLVAGIDVFGIASITQLVAFLQGRPMPLVDPIEVIGDPVGKHAKRRLDPGGRGPVEVEAKWACEVAAAGRHHMLFHGPPGVGKTMLAERVPGLLPDLDVRDALEVSAVLARRLQPCRRAHRRTTLQRPHHSASVASIVGGGQRMARPGAISCAHRGVLFLDEAPEFQPTVIEALRTPLESGMITLGRSEVHARYPARFQLILAANPCPCGQAATPGAHCQCSPTVVRRYAEKISGPIRDRIDINQAFLPLRKAYLKATLQRVESSTVVAERVLEARGRQLRRRPVAVGRPMARFLGPTCAVTCAPPTACRPWTRRSVVGTQRRGVDKLLRLAWTVAILPAATSRAATNWRRWRCGGGEQPGTVWERVG
jgi:magnesium chelatase family protein